MRGLTITFISFMLMFSYTYEDIVSDFKELKEKLPEQLHPIFDYDLPQRELIKVYKNLMLFLAPYCTINSNSLSEVLFEIVTLKIYDRRPGKEIDESFLLSKTDEIIQKMKELNTEPELRSLAQEIILIINGYRKAHSDSQMRPLHDFIRKLKQVIKNDDWTNEARAKVFLEFGIHMNKYIMIENKIFKDFLKIQGNIVSIAENLMKAIILSFYQPNFKLSYFDTYKLRALEVVYFLRAIHNYNDITSISSIIRISSLRVAMTIPTEQIDTLMFDDIEKDNVFLLNRRREFIKKEKEKIIDFLVYTTIKTRNYLGKFRSIVDDKEMGIERPKVEKKGKKNQKPQLEKQDIKIEEEEIKIEEPQLEKQEIQNQQPQLEKKGKKNQKVQLEKQEIQNQQPQLEKKGKKNQKVQLEKQEIQNQQPQAGKKGKKNQKVQAKQQQKEIQNPEEKNRI